MEDCSNDMCPSDDDCWNRNSEEWKCIDGIWVSYLGRIRRSSGQVYIPLTLSGQYRAVYRHKKLYTVHRLVARAFLGEPPNSNCTVDHINQNKLDNRVVNLRWSTISEQNQNRPKFRQAQNVVPIEVDFGDGVWVRFESAMDLTDKKYNMSRCCIGNCLAGRSKSHKGAKFRYASVEEVLEGELWHENDVCFISNHGRVKSKHPYKNNQPYFPKADKSGYCYAFGRAVHRMVAFAFLGPPPSPLHDTVDHINRIRDCNHVSNLMWATPEMQRANTVHKIHDFSLHCTKVESIDSSGNSTVFESVASAAKAVNVMPQGIHKAISKGTKARGRTWKRIN